MADPITLIVGLGNPGKEYETTRHNAGFWFVDEIARAHGVSFKPESKFFGELAQFNAQGEKIFLLKPTTFMNRSGQSVAAVATFYKLPLCAMLIAHDELDFEPGIVRLKLGGGHGGHNGLRDIIARMGNNKEFLRLRIGVGHPGHREQVTGHVLGRTPQGERELIDRSLDDAIRVLPELVAGEIQKATNKLHSNNTLR
ncbi:MAG: aminoacyl-tRNA hydrolase [Gammaproteobacteria bacterium]|nr:aminoacyl-tRNA hydrolase [Gammaproteobacteria bacterium]